MIKLLVIDDESDIREGIKDSINWKENDIVITGEASNGVEALDIINQTFPDVLLVDIRMPLMNGLQLIESLSNTHPYIKSIIISGYDDFAYAKKALQLGACDYLLKPCGPEEILEAVLRVKTTIEEERKQKEIILTYKESLSENHQFIKTRYLTSLFNEITSQDGLLMDKFELINLNLSKNNFMVMVIRIDSLNTLLQQAKTNDVDLLKYAITNMSEEIISARYNCEVFEYKDDIIVILNIEKNHQISTEPINNIKSEINNRLNLTVSIGISNFCSDVNKLHLLYRQALAAVEYRFFRGENSTVYYNDLGETSSKSCHYPLELEKNIINSIKAGNEDELEKYFNSLFKLLIEKDSNKQYILKTCMSLLFSIYHLLVENNADEDEIMKEIDCLNDIAKFGTINELKRKVHHIIMLAFEKINHSKIGNKYIQSALDYINENYSKDIDLETVAKHIYTSPSYVSSLFKQVLGINFVDYLHKYRLNKACELMKDNRLKAYEIAYMVGYNDDKYFSQIFKKHLGITPSKYRETII